MNIRSFLLELAGIALMTIVTVVVKFYAERSERAVDDRRERPRIATCVETPRRTVLIIPSRCGRD